MIKNNDTKDKLDAESAGKKKLQPVLKDDGAKETGGPKGLEPTVSVIGKKKDAV
jgi:hypothetical protein